MLYCILLCGNSTFALSYHMPSYDKVLCLQRSQADTKQNAIFMAMNMKKKKKKKNKKEKYKLTILSL